MSEPPFRGDLEAAHRRIEQLTADYEARIAELRAENARLLQRVVDANMTQRPKPSGSAMPFVIIGALVATAAVIAFAWTTRTPHRLVREEGPTLLPVAGSVDPTIAIAPAPPRMPPPVMSTPANKLPACHCTQGDPLCSEIPGQTCTPQ